MFIRLSLPVLIAALALSPGLADAAHAWQQITTGDLHNVFVDSHDRLWLQSPAEGLRVSEGGWRICYPDSVPDWRPVPIPFGYENRNFTVTGGDTLFVVAQAHGTNDGTVFRRPASGGDWDELPVTDTFGFISQIMEDHSGRVWVLGERGEIFRLAEGVWIKERMPFPFQPTGLFTSPQGSIWAQLTSHRSTYLLIREEGAWRSVGGPLSVTLSQKLTASGRSAAVRIGTRILRVAAGPPAQVREWFDLGTECVVTISLNEAWAVRNRHLLHVQGDEVRDLGLVPFVPYELIWRRGELFAHSSTGLWRMLPGVEADVVSPPLGLVKLEADFPYTEVPSSFGVGVLRLQGVSCIYLTRHTITDAIIPLGTIEGMKKWVELSAELGVSDHDEHPLWSKSYEMGVVTADVNGDGTEDVLLTTMREGARMFRNMKDKRLVPWTEQSGLAETHGIIGEDVDLIDADADGDLDLYVCNLQGDDQLFLNDGAANFREVMQATGLVSPIGSLSAICRDLDGDGDTDVAVSTCGAGLFLHENLGPRAGLPRFRTRVLLTDIVHPDVPTGLTGDNYTGAEVLDWDDDGLPDLFLAGTNQPLRFLRNLGGMEFTPDESVFADGPPTPRTGGVLGIDPDADGDWDLAVTGDGGARFLENIGGVLHALPGSAYPRPTTAQISTNGCVQADIDGDGDLDFFEAARGSRPIVYRNDNTGRPFLVRVIGPAENRSAVGARVELRHAVDGRRAAPMREIPGGSAYVSHDTKELAYGGLDPDASYDLVVSLPSGKRRTFRDLRPGPPVVLAMESGVAGFVSTVRTRIVACSRDRRCRTWVLATAVATFLVGIVTIWPRRHAAGVLATAGTLAVPSTSGVVRALFPLDPGYLPVVVAPLAGLVAGLLIVLSSRTPRPEPSTALLADFQRSLRIFDHNQSPRRILDRIRLLRENMPPDAEGREAVLPLLREDVELLGAVAAPEMAYVVEGAGAAGLDPGVGGELLKRLRRERNRVFSGATANLSALDAMLAAVAEFRRWVADMQRRVDARLTTRMKTFLLDYAASREALHSIRVTVSTPDVAVRIPASELARVLDVLLENAARAGASRLEVSGETVSEAALRLNVIDDGAGVDEELRQRIFEMGVSGMAGGTGFGLYAARRILDSYGGMVVCEDADAGARFVVQLVVVSMEGDKT